MIGLENLAERFVVPDQRGPEHTGGIGPAGIGLPPSMRWNLAPSTCLFHMKSRLVAISRAMSS